MAVILTVVDFLISLTSRDSDASLAFADRGRICVDDTERLPDALGHFQINRRVAGQLASIETGADSAISFEIVEGANAVYQPDRACSG